MRLGGDAGDSQRALDLRLLDFTGRAEKLPGLIELPARKRAAPGSASNNPVPVTNRSLRMLLSRAANYPIFFHSASAVFSDGTQV